MKKLCSFLITCMIASFAIAQVNSGTVTISVTGNRNKQITVDGQSYTIGNTTAASEKDVVINDLANGSHTLQIIRTSPGTTRTTTTNTSFTLRQGYDLDITVNSAGAVTLTEKRGGRVNNGRPIGSAAYTKLYNATKAKSSSTARAAFLENEFVNTNKRFTSKQASQLIQLVNSESARLALAKNAYTRVTDQQNFSLVRNLLKSTANRTNLDSYIATIQVDEDNDGDGNASTPISNQKFTTIYNEVLAETSNSDRNYYLSNFFTKDFNFYTSYQAKQLIQLVSTEQERLYLAKVAYRGITDRPQYDQVVNLLNSNSNRSELRTYIASFDQNNNNTGVAMTSTQFNSLYQSVSYQTSTTERLNAINTAFTTSGNYFTASQAKQLIQLVNIESSRLLLTKTAYKVLVDRPNYTVFNDLFTSQSNRNDLADYVYNYDNTGVGTGMAMTDAQFKILYNNVYAAGNTTARYSLINAAFQNSNNYFSAAQERTLLLLINSESNRMELAKLGYDNLVDRNNYTVMSDLFASSGNRNEWARFANEYNGGINNTAMTDADFNVLYNSVSAAWNTASRYSLVNTAFQNSNNYFTTTQARQLLLLINTESDRLSLAKLSYDNLVDRSNYTVMSDLFASSTNRNEWTRFANEYSGGGDVYVKVPMTDTEFSSVYRSIQFTFGIGAKMSGLTEVFNKETNYFTVAQTKQLIQLVSSESNRLELAKLAYGNLTDPANYTELYTVFTTQASKDEFNAYVGSNAYLNK